MPRSEWVEKLPLAQAAYRAIHDCPTVDQLTEIWKSPSYGYLVLGHKVLARMAFLGQSPERAMGVD